MNIKDYFAALGRSTPGHHSDPIENYIQYIVEYIGDQDLVNFCFAAMLREVDFKKGEFAKWSAVSPDYRFISFKTFKDEEVKIPLTGKLKTLFQQAHATSCSELVFDNQYTLVIKIGAIILFSTGFGAYELNNFSGLYKIRKENQDEKTLPKQDETRLCTEPWEHYRLGKNGEVLPCSQIPAIWNIENYEELSTGIDSLQKSLLAGKLNCLCMNCSLKPATSVRHLAHELAGKQLGNAKSAIVAELLASHKTKKQELLPPQHLRFRISGTRDAKIFMHNGVVGSEQMVSYVEKYDHSPQRSLLDWGCGCGRYAYHITKKWPQISYTGADVDAEAINWCNTHLTQGTFVVTDFYPPTSFANEQFTSVIASSVMTHLTQQNQLVWLKEMHRILKPGGIFIASVLGFTAALRIPRLEKKLRKKGFIDYHQDPALNGIAPEGYYRDVFQTEQYTRQNWSTFFEIKEYVPAGLMGYQDLVILQKKEFPSLNDQESSRSKSWFRTLFRH